MKNIFYILSFIVLFAACAPQETEFKVPEKVDDMRAILKAKKENLRETERQIAELEAAIEAKDPKKEKRALVTTEKLKTQDFKHFVEIQGSVQSDDFAIASSETGGRLLSVNAIEGQNVRKGQLIARVDLEAIQKQIAEVQTSLDLAKEVFNRQKRLWDQNIGSEIQFLQAKNNVERLEKTLESLNYQTTKANVYAPISGVIEMVMLKQGELAGPGAPIVQILNTSKVKVVAEVPESLLTSVKRGETVTVKFPALGTEQKAKISLIGRQINPANRTFKVEVNLSNSKGLLKPNLLATMLINDNAIKDAVVVPLELVQQEVSGKSFVYVNQDSTAQKVYVQLGDSYQGNIVITEGLKGNEEIIVEGARNLVDGDLIKL